MVRRILLTLVLTAATGLSLAGVASAAPGDDVSVANAPCGTSVSDQDGSAWNTTAETAARQRSGSSTSCATNGVLQTADRADYHCYTWDSIRSATWTYLRNVRTGVEGWVRDDLLSDSGSRVECVF